MKAERIPRILLLAALSAFALPTNAQNAITVPNAQGIVVAASQGALTKYQCAVTTKEGAVQKTVISAGSEDAAKTAAVKKGGSPSGSKGVSCARLAESEAAQADSSVQKAAVKTRAPTPPIIDRSRIEFEKDGSCRLSKEAMGAYPDAPGKCRRLPDSEGVVVTCPADYCATLR